MPAYRVIEDRRGPWVEFFPPSIGVLSLLAYGAPPQEPASAAT